MAPRTRARRQAETATPVSHNMPTPIATGNASHDGNTQLEERPWTPLPKSYNPKTYTSWGRKHYGEDWYELRETMIRERIYHLDGKLDLRNDHVFLIRQSVLRKMEREREAGKFLPVQGKTWQELMAWARCLYGEDWCVQWQDLVRAKHAVEDATLSVEEREENRRVANRLEATVERIQQLRNHEELLKGRTWDDIMAWPPAAVQHTLPSADTDSASESSNDPSTDTDSASESSLPSRKKKKRKNNSYFERWHVAKTQAETGPKRDDSSEGHYLKRLNYGYWEYDAIKSHMTEKEYEKEKISLEEYIRKARSQQEAKEAKERDLQEEGKIRSQMHRRFDTPQEYAKAYVKYEIEMTERVESMRVLSRLHEAWIQEQINSLPRNQQEMDQRFDRWEIQGISRKEGNCLARMYGFQERPPFVEFYDRRLVWPPPRLAERLPLPLADSECRHYEPLTDETPMERQFRYWDGRLSRAEQNELARIYGLGERPSSLDGDDEPQGQQQRQPSVQKDYPNHFWHYNQVFTKMEKTPPNCFLPPKKYRRERSSRRLCGLKPELGMLPQRGEPAAARVQMGVVYPRS